MWQFGNQLPASARWLVDCGIGNAVGLGEFGILKPTVIVDHTPQEMTIDGIRFVFQNIPHSEAPAGNADATLTLTKGMFLKMVVGKGEIRDLLGDEIRTTGSRIDLARFFSLFKQPTGSFPIAMP